MGLLKIQLTAWKEQSLAVCAASWALERLHAAGMAACGINSLSFISGLCIELSGAPHAEVEGDKECGIQ